MLKKRFFLCASILLTVILVSAKEQGVTEKPVKPEVGKTAPDILGRLLDKKLLKLEELLKKKDKLILVDFWATWCPPCRAEIPHLQKAYKEYHEKGLVIISINVDEPSETIEAFIKKTEMPWYHIRDIDSKLSALYKVEAIPSPFLIDPNGILVAMGEDLRGPKLEKTLARQIKNLPKKEEISQ